MFASTPGSDAPAPGSDAPAPNEASAVNRITCSPIQASAIRAAISGSPIRPLPRADASTASNSRAKPGCCPNVDTPRSTPSVPMATRHPSPGAPMRSSATASEKNTSLNSEVPVSCTIGRTRTPACRIGTSRQDKPRCRCAIKSVRASTKHQSANWANDVHTFCPSTCHLPSGPTTARVRSPARSDPASGSEYPWHQIDVPARIPGRNRAFCSAVPNISKVGPSSCSPMCPTRPGAPARAYSSWKMTCWRHGRPRPPSATGQPSPIQPPSPSRRSHASRSAANSCSRPGPPFPTSPANSPDNRAASHDRTQARNSSSSTVDRQLSAARRASRMDRASCPASESAPASALCACAK